MKNFKQIHFGVALSFIIVLLGIGTSSAQTPPSPVVIPAGWSVFKAPNGAFSVALPKSLTSETQDLGAEANHIKATYHTSDGANVFVVIADLHDLKVRADKFDETTSKFLFEKFSNGLVKGFQDSFEKSGLKMSVTFGAPKSIVHRSLRGREQTVSIGMFKAQTRMLLSADHIFMLFVMPMPGQDEKHVEMVFSSFQALSK